MGSLGSECTRLLDICQGFIQLFLGNGVVAVILGSCRYGRMDILLEPGEDSLHIDRLLVRMGCGAVWFLLGLWVLAAAAGEGPQAH